MSWQLDGRVHRANPSTGFDWIVWLKSENLTENTSPLYLKLQFSARASQEELVVVIRKFIPEFELGSF